VFLTNQVELVMKTKNKPAEVHTAKGGKVRQDSSNGKTGNGKTVNGKMDQARREGSKKRSRTAPERDVTNRGRMELFLCIVPILACFAWAYWPTLVRMVDAWERQPDYSHGYFVVPLALYFCWARRDRFPGMSGRLAWMGLLILLLSIAIRMAGARYYVDAIDAWSMVVWVAGVVCLLGGWRVLLWALPSIGFLIFMIPLPWSAERMLSLPLQRIATKLSTWVFQLLGQPAIAEGNTIWLGEYQLEVAQACSGLRIFVGIFALAFAYIILVRRTWWERLLLLLSAVPIALVANSTRIVVTGLLYLRVSGEAAHKFTHDISGYVMIPFAAVLFAIVLWYVGNITREMESLDMRDVLQDQLT
jgi:exosortase